MINFIKSKFSRNKLLVENFLSLSTLQALNYVIPLITLPYLVRTLGPERYGLIAFAQAFSLYFIIITDYGFNLSATREISMNRDNNYKVSNIFCSVFLVKSILLIFSTIIYCIIVFSIKRFSIEYPVFLFSFIMVIGNYLFPVWLFQGLQKMKYVTIINIIIKSLFIFPLFIFIHSPADYYFVPIINSTSFFVAGIISLIFSLKILKVQLIIPTKKDLINQFKDGWPFFISTIAISVYTISNTFILGFFTNNTIVGYYSSAEKIIRALQKLIHPLSQALYPHISYLVSNSREKTIIFLRKILFIIGCSSFLISLLTFIFSNQIVLTILGDQYIKSIPIMRIFAFLPFIIAISNVFGIQTMLNFKMEKEFSKILIFASCLSIILSLVLVNIYQQIGIAISVLITEIFVTGTMFFYLNKKGIKIWKK